MVQSHRLIGQLHDADPAVRAAARVALRDELLHQGYAHNATVAVLRKLAEAADGSDAESAALCIHLISRLCWCGDPLSMFESKELSWPIAQKVGRELLHAKLAEHSNSLVVLTALAELIGAATEQSGWSFLATMCEHPSPALRDTAYVSMCACAALERSSIRLGPSEPRLAYHLAASFHTPLCQRHVRQPPLEFCVPMGGEWISRRAETNPSTWS